MHLVEQARNMILVTDVSFVQKDKHFRVLKCWRETFSFIGSVLTSIEAIHLKPWILDFKRALEEN